MIIDSEIFYGDLPQVIEDIAISQGGLGTLDSLGLEILANWNNRVYHATSLGYTKNEAIPGFDAMFVEAIDWKKSGSLATGTVRGVGLETFGERRKRRLSVAGQEISVGPIEKVLIETTDKTGVDASTGSSVVVKKRVAQVDDTDGKVKYETIGTPSGSFERWAINQAFVTINDTYFVTGTTAPSTILAGSAVTPPSPPAVPAYLWGGYNQPMRARHPNGWVLESREIDELFPGLWAVVDNYGYFYEAVPD